jgi:GT2 family glycosyltransferase
MVVLTFNQLDETKKCFDSLERHTRLPYELIVVDNASTDGTVEYLRDYAASRHHVKVVENVSNRGFAGGNNQGLALARGKYLLLINNDTVVTPLWLEDLIEIMERHPDTGLVGPMSNYVGGLQLVKDVSYRDLFGLEAFAADRRERFCGDAPQVRHLSAFCLLVRRPVIERIGGLDEIFRIGNFEDNDFCLRAGLAGFDLRIAGGVFIHHTGSKSFGGRENYQKRLLANWEVFKAKWGIDPRTPYGGKYRIEPETAKRMSFRLDLPDLGKTHQGGLEGRWWSEKETEESSTTKICEGA